MRNRARVQFRLGLPEARRRRRGAATRLSFGMRTEVEVEMAALRPGSEGLFLIISQYPTAIPVFSVVLLPAARNVRSFFFLISVLVLV